jgi:putative transposase
MTGRAETQLTGNAPGAEIRDRLAADSWCGGTDGGRMARPSRFSGDEIAAALRQVDGGATAVQVCRKLGITQTTFYRWRKKFGRIAGGELREVKELRDENQKLKQIVANLLLEKL